MTKSFAICAALACLPLSPVKAIGQDIAPGLSLAPRSQGTSKVLPTPVRKTYGSETTQFPSRIIYLNGTNISTVRDEELENVKVRIDTHGNIFLEAPHYEAHQDSSYHPLLPGELPRLPKERTAPENLPKGRYSKETGQQVQETSHVKDEADGPLGSKASTVSPLPAAGASNPRALPAAPLDPVSAAPSAPPPLPAR